MYLIEQQQLIIIYFHHINLNVAPDFIEPDLSLEFMIFWLFWKRHGHISLNEQECMEA